ncbi:tetratricopeptide repeat protein [Psychromicrobium lacuslunae]|uniref:tetratricopeptide repeat protein n=1 Tax=Psychromicrobium lacuslunae TaxID=1618207 RepID=UPI000695D617|nr:hypothetical protein [Psychromicrobium lacuslunae]
MSATLIPNKVPETIPSEPAPTPKPARLVLRRRLLIFTIPLVLLVLLIAGKFLSVSIASAQLNAAFARGDAAGVHSAAGVLKFANLLEPYKAWFNDGDGYVLQGDFEAAKGQFEEALRLAPEKESCKVRVNLVLTLEKLGDAKKAAGDQSGAKALYDNGLAVTDQAPEGCFQQGSEGNQQGEGQSLQESKERLNEKSQNSGQNQQDPGQPNQSPNSPADPSKLEQLKQQQKEAQKDRTDGKQGSGNVGNLPDDPNGKQW